MLFILDTRQNTVGVANNTSPSALPYFDDEHRENLDGLSTYTFTIPADHDEAHKIEVNGHIIIRDLDGKHIMFTIKEVNDYKDFDRLYKRVFCDNTAIDELIGDVQRPIKLASSTLENTVKSIMSSASSGWTTGYIDYTYSTDFEIPDHMTVLEALTIVSEIYSVEMYFTVELDGTKIVKKQVNMVEQRGTVTDLRFDYPHNLVNVSRTEDTTRLCTALVGVGKGDENNKRITLEGLAAYDNGIYYKLASADWIGSHESLQRWSRNGEHIFGIHIDEDATTLDQLKRSTERELAKRSVPNLLYSSVLLDLERVSGYEARRLRIGDTITIKDSTFKPEIVISARLKEVVRSYVDHTKDSANLGSYKPISYSTSAKLGKLQKLVSLNEARWNAVTYVVEVVSSGGTVFKNGTGSTTLKAKVYEASNEIDVNGTELTYTWSKYDSTGTLITTWSKSGKEITIADTDVDTKATFICEVN